MPIATTYNSIGNREHILDYLTVVEPEETPKLSSFSKGPTPKAMLVEWQADDLDAASFAGVPEGEDVSTFNFQGDGRALLSNRMHKFRDHWQVTTEQEAISTAGVPSEVAYAKAKSMKQLKRSIEAAIGADQEAVAGGGGAAYKMRGMAKWLDATNTEIPAAYRMPAASLGTTSSLTEAALNVVLQSVYEQNGVRKTFRLFCGPTLKGKISGFTRAEGTTTATPYVVSQGADSNKVTFNVMRYEGDFGSVDLVPDLWQERSTGVKAIAAASREAGLLIDPSLVSIGYLEQPFAKELDDNGAGRRGYCEAIVTLLVKNPLGLGRFT